MIRMKMTMTMVMALVVAIREENIILQIYK